MPQSFTNLLYHIVFSTKDRAPQITVEIEERLHRYLGGTIRGKKGICLEINGVADHVHLLARLRQDQSIAEFIRDLKSNSSGWVHDTFPASKDFAWQGGYAAFTVSESQVARVISYIRKQKEHHKRVSFQDEFLALLRANKIEFDERYLWR